MSKPGEKHLHLICSDGEKAAMQASADAKGLTLSNYVRYKLGLPFMFRGERKDLAPPEPGKRSRRKTVNAPTGV